MEENIMWLTLYTVLLHLFKHSSLDYTSLHIPANVNIPEGNATLVIRAFDHHTCGSTWTNCKHLQQETQTQEAC